MIIGVAREVTPGETRVALAPAAVRRLSEAGLEIRVQPSAGLKSGHLDADYESAGATLTADARQIFAESDILVRVQAPLMHPETGQHEAEMLPEGGCLIGVLQP